MFSVEQGVREWISGRLGKAGPNKDRLASSGQDQRSLSGYEDVFDKYESVIYGMYAANDDREATRDAALAFLDLLLEERGFSPLAGFRTDYESRLAAWFDHLMPVIGNQRVVDAKYKRHWEEMQRSSWMRLEEQIQEQHRDDLFQALAYANLSSAQTAIVCLVYPCSPENWDSLLERKRVIHRAEFAVGDRSIHLWLTAFPMMAKAEEVASVFADAVRKGIPAD